MRTFKFTSEIEGKITIPDTVLRDLRNMAAEEPEDGGANHLNRLHKEFYEDDDAFLQAALKTALRSIVRAGLLADLSGLGDGVGFRVAPAQVEVSVPEQVITKVKARSQLAYGGELPVTGDESEGAYKEQTFDLSTRIVGGPKLYGEPGALEQADPDA